MAFDYYACDFNAGNDRYHFSAMDIEEAASWCSEMFFEHFNDSRFVCATCIYMDTEQGPIDFTFGFYRDGSLVVADNHIDCFVFYDWAHDEILVGVNELIEWVLSIVKD